MNATYDVPAPLNDPDVRYLEALRVELKAPPPAFYIRVKVDNRSKELFDAADIEVNDARGRVITVSRIMDLLKQWAVDTSPVQPLDKWFRIASETRFSAAVGGGNKATVVIAIMELDASIESIIHTGRDVRLKRKTD